MKVVNRKSFNAIIKYQYLLDSLKILWSTDTSPDIRRASMGVNTEKTDNIYTYDVNVSLQLYEKLMS